MKTSEAVVLAGGLGTRLSGVVKDLPKPMAPIAGRPFLECILFYLKGQGISRVVLAVGHLREVIMGHFGNKWNSIDLEYSIENEPLGTGGALLQASRQISGDRFFVINGDTFFPVSLSELENFHLDRKSQLSLALKPLENFDRYGTVLLDPAQKIIRFEEKRPVEKGFINGGIYLAEKTIWKSGHFPSKFSFEKEVLEALVHTLPMYGMPSEAYFIDIGIPEDYARAQKELTLREGNGFGNNDGQS